jgi:hypothetical protein
MDPEKGGLLQTTITGILYAILFVAYQMLKIVLRNRVETIIEPKHLLEPPMEPASSVQLASALNPKTSVDRLLDLANSGDILTRRALARNPGLPIDTLKKLSTDIDSIVAQEAMQILATRREFSGVTDRSF